MDAKSVLLITSARKGRRNWPILGRVRGLAEADWAAVAGCTGLTQASLVGGGGRMKEGRRRTTDDRRQDEMRFQS